MRLSEHFVSAEFDCHDGTPVPRHAYDDLKQLCQLYLEPLRRRFGLAFIVSGYRTPSHNRNVDGALNSWHIYRQGRAGAAADVRFKHGTPAEWYELVDELGPGGLAKYATHIHVDNRRGRARW